MSLNISYNPAAIVRGTNHAPDVGTMVMVFSNEDTIANDTLIKMNNNVVSRAVYPLLSAAVPVDPTNVQWITREQGNTYNFVRYLNSNFIVGGNTGRLMVSSDGEEFSLTATGATENFHDAFYGLSLYMLVGSSGRLMTSSNALTWTARASNFSSSSINSGVVGGGVAIIVGDDGKIASSTNATTWTLRTSNMSGNHANKAVYDGSFFTVVGNAGTLVTSPDGVSWTVRTSGFGASNINDAFVKDGNVWIFGDDGKISNSPNLITWTQQPSPFGVGEHILTAENVNGILYISTSNKVAVSSDNGVTWVILDTISGETSFSGFAYGGGYTVFVGDVITSGETYNSATDIFLPKYNLEHNLFNMYMRAGVEVV